MQTTVHTRSSQINNLQGSNSPYKYGSLPAFFLHQLPTLQEEAKQFPNQISFSQQSSAASRSAMATKIYIVYYSTWGHVATLAEEIKKGADTVPGVEVTVWRVPETLPEEVLGKMHAAPGREDHPVITASQLAEADGILFGFPTRFGMMAAQMKAFFDSTGRLWQEGSLAGKPAGIFLATGTQGGGQETTALTAITQLTHHGMLFVPVGYTHGAGMFAMDEVKGGSPYGSGTFAGKDGGRTPSDAELALAAHQGKYFAGIAKKLNAV
ncbi:quinone-oxidoreductase QR2-like [Triticum urartu]|nr:quinone-oxidoreductase QR2-like [Triticum urartu]